MEWTDKQWPRFCAKQVGNPDLCSQLPHVQGVVWCGLSKQSKTQTIPSLPPRAVTLLSPNSDRSQQFSPRNQPRLDQQPRLRFVALPLRPKPMKQIRGRIMTHGDHIKRPNPSQRPPAPLRECSKLRNVSSLQCWQKSNRPWKMTSLPESKLLKARYTNCLPNNKG